MLRRVATAVLTPLWDDDTNRLRAGWRVLLGVGVALAGVLAAGAIVSARPGDVGRTALLGPHSLAVQFVNTGVSCFVSLCSLGVLAEALCRLRGTTGHTTSSDPAP